MRLAFDLFAQPARRVSQRRRMTGCPALVFALILVVPALANAAGACPKDQTRASGQPERTIFSQEASRGIRAAWCEAYDAAGRSTRVGAYRERYPTGLLRLEANYERGRLNGPVVAYHENGEVFLRGRGRADSKRSEQARIDATACIARFAHASA